jgi:hypothetical protein
MARVHTRLLLTSLLFSVVWAVPAFAQGSAAAGTAADGKSYPSCEGRTVSPQDQEAARAAFTLAQTSYNESDYAKAIEYLRDAYRRDCTAHELLRNLARAYETKGDKAEAIKALETYLERVPKAQDADSIQRRIANLKAQLQPAPSPTTAPVAPAPKPTVTTPPSSPPPSPPPPEDEGEGAEGKHSVAPWVVVGVGGAAVVAGAIMIGVGVSEQASSRAGCTQNTQGQYVCGPGIDPAQRQSQNQTGAATATAGVVIGIVGVAAVGGGLLWHFLEPTGAETTKSGRPRLVPQLAPGYAGFGLEGRF